MEQGHGKTHPALLAATQILDKFGGIWQIEQFEQEFCAILDVAFGHRRNDAEVD